MEPVKPAWDEGWVGQLHPNLARGEWCSFLPDVGEVKATALLIADGLGANVIREHLSSLKTIKKFIGPGLTDSPITTVAPSTTAAALPSFTTGLTPGEHGLLAYRIPVQGGILNVLGWKGDEDPKPATPPAYLPDPLTFSPNNAVSAPIVMPKRLVGSNFSKAHLSSMTVHGVKSGKLWPKEAIDLLKGSNPARHIVIYDDLIDKVGHREGMASKAMRDALAELERRIQLFLVAAPRGTALVISADHGLVDIGPKECEDLQLDNVRVTAGEGRFRTLWANEGLEEELLAQAVDRYGDRCWVFSREELIKDNWFSPRNIENKYLERLPDVAIVPYNKIAITVKEKPNEANMKARHGSLTEEEMFVPALVQLA